MKNLKKKLMAAISMMLIATMMLTSVSYAWYTLSTNPEVKGIKATAVANENLEIALDNFYANGVAIDTASQNATAGGSQGSTTGNDYTWGNSVDVANQMAGTGGTDTFELRPAEYFTPDDATKLHLQTYKYGTDGRISAVQALTEYSEYGADGTLDTVDSNVTTSTQVNGVAAIYNDDSATDENYAFKVVYWLRTNIAGNIDLSAATGLADGADTDDLALGSGSYISTSQYALGTEVDKYPSNAIKVAFKVTPDGGTATWVDDANIVYGSVLKKVTSGTGATATAEWKAADYNVDTDAGETDSGERRVLLSMAEGEHLFAADANKAYKVEMYVYLNGDVVTNAMAEADITDIVVNVQFDNDALDADKDGESAMKY